MRLRRATASRLYGRLDLAIEIDHVTVITGPNESGKSSAAGLVELVLRGPSGPSWPLLGEKPTYDWLAELEFDGAPTVKRGMFRGEHFVMLQHLPVGPKEAARTIQETFGSAVTWSAQSFMGDSAKSRLEWLLAKVVDGAGWDKERVTDVVHDVLGPDETSWPPGSGWAQEPTGRQALDRLLVDLRAADLEADREARRLAKVVEHETVAASSAAPLLPPGTVATWAKEREAIDKDLGEALERRGVAEGTASSLKLIRQDESAVLDELATIAAMDHGSAVAKVQAEIERIGTARTNATKALEEAEGAFAAAQNRVGDLQAKLDVATRGGEVWKAALVAAPVFAPAMQYLARVRDADAEAGVILDALTVALADSGTGAVNEIRGLQLQHAAAAREADRARTMLATAERGASGLKWANQEAALHAELAKLRPEARAEKQTALMERLETIRARAAAVPELPLDSIDAHIEGLRAKRTNAQKAIDTLTDAAAEMAGQMEHRKGLASAKERRSKYRDAIKALEEVRAEMTVALFAPLRERVSHITEAVLGARWDIDTNGGWNWDLWRGEDRHAHGSRSGNIVAMAALHVAIAEKLGGWRHVVLDDLESLEEPRRERLVRALCDEVRDGRLDNAIVACAGSWNFAPSHECSVVEMGVS